MKIAIFIPTYNRPKYLKQCLEYLGNADFKNDSDVFIYDDSSTDEETTEIIIKTNYNVSRNCVNSGIVSQLYRGYNHLFDIGYDIVINIDSDALVRNDFVDRLIENYIQGTLLTGFHSTTCSALGEPRHIIIEETEHHYIKKSVGGINFCIDKEAYLNFVKPALEECIVRPTNWDHLASLNAGMVYCLKQSVIQHIGFESTLGHHENPDTADSFIDINLPMITLFGIDSNKERLNIAKDICTKNIQFGRVVTMNPDIRSKEAYSTILIKECYKYVDTTHVLIFQHDGFINNWKAWDNSWLQYDYIGAPWWYMDGMNVGNGGFSLRSKRLMEIVATDPEIKNLHPEDHHICRTYRPYLEKKYGIKFAPIEVAEKFAFEGYMQPQKVLSNQFGVHGSNPRKVPAQPIRTTNYVFCQFLSLGDILFLIPLYRALVAEGNTVLWPIDEMYLPIKKHFKDVNFVNKSDYDLPYDSRARVQTPYGMMLPYRFASENMGRTLHKCMESKYHLYGHDHNMWRQLIWERDKVAEAKLIKALNLPKKFNLVNRTYGHLAVNKIEPIINTEYPCIEMRNIEGFTLIDWLGVIEKATELHISNSSLNYLLELMEFDIPVHLYPRRMWGEVKFEYTRHLFNNKNFIYHEQ